MGGFGSCWAGRGELLAGFAGKSGDRRRVGVPANGRRAFWPGERSGRAGWSVLFAFSRCGRSGFDEQQDFPHFSPGCHGCHS